MGAEGRQGYGWVWFLCNPSREEFRGGVLQVAFTEIR